jgi:hypothetical protein
MKLVISLNNQKRKEVVILNLRRPLSFKHNLMSWFWLIISLRNIKNTGKIKINPIKYNL